MIISDPWGQWTSGAREGQQDAIAAREAQDRTAQNAYGLNTAAQSDPFRLKMLQNAANESNINNNLMQTQYDNGDLYNMHHAAAQEAQLKPAEALANYGYTGGIARAIPSMYPDVGVGSAGFSTPINGANGTHTNLETPGAGLVAPNQIHGMYQQYIAQLRAEHIQALDRVAGENLTLKQQIAASKGINGAPPQHSVLAGLNPAVPAASTVSPAPANALNNQTDYAKMYNINPPSPVGGM